VRLWRWADGRQGGGYRKLPLLRSRLLRLDAYLLRFPEGSQARWHTDPSPVGWRHWRANLTLRPARDGGRFLWAASMGPRVRRLGPLTVFRPDVTPHALTRVERGSLWLLSVGWLRRGD
jgi:hypothetical protein